MTGITETGRGLTAAPPEVWAAVRADYLSGLSAPECCARHGVSLTSLRGRAASEGWRRQDQPWTPPDRLDPCDEGLDLEIKVDGNMDRIELCELAYVAHRRMMRAVLRGDAAEALRWRRVQGILDSDHDETMREMERDDVLNWRHGPAGLAALPPDGSNGSDGVFESGDDLSSPSLCDGEVDASPLRADGGGDSVSTNEHPAALTQPPSRPLRHGAEDAPRHLPIRQAANGEES